MIILITGASHTGKTLLAQRLLEKYIEDHFDEIIGHESEIESRLIEADCTIDDLKQCNRWFIEAFGSAGENVVLIEDDFGKAMESITEIW